MIMSEAKASKKKTATRKTLPIEDDWSRKKLPLKVIENLQGQLQERDEVVKKFNSAKESLEQKNNGINALISSIKEFLEIDQDAQVNFDWEKGEILYK